MSESTILTVLAFLKPLMLVLGFLVLLFIALTWLFRDMIKSVVVRLLFRKMPQSDADFEHPRRRYEDKDFEEVLKIVERLAKAQEDNVKQSIENGVNLRNLLDGLRNLKDSIDSIANELRDALAVTNRRIDEILLRREEN